MKKINGRRSIQASSRISDLSRLATVREVNEVISDINDELSQIREEIIGTGIVTVDNYNSLPLPSTVSGQYFFVLNTQGLKWLPGNLGGNFYNKGIYRSNGLTWEYIDIPYQSSQSDVGIEVGDGGIIEDSFVSPKTLRNKGYSRINKICDESIPAHRVVILENDRVVLFDPFNITHYNKVLGISYQSGNTGDSVDIITDDEIDFGITMVNGAIYYGGISGTLTNIPPITGIMQSLGWAHSNGKFIVHIGTPVLKS